MAAADAVNAFSVTSYHLNASGLVSTCNANYTACGWDGDVEAFSSDVQGASDGALTAIPLVFNNAGHMVSYFRTMAAGEPGRSATHGADATVLAPRPPTPTHPHPPPPNRCAPPGRAEGNQQQVVDYLVAAAAEYGFEALSIDLEPSCWGGNASACEFPTSDDVAALHAFIDLLADGLHGAGRRLSVAAGSYPVAQCDNGFPQYELCADEYVPKCRDGTYNISTCNCCGFTSWFEPTGLCATKADRIVNMDTYMSPFDTAFFQDAMAWYYAAGCSAEQVAVGLLASETSDDGQVDEMFGG